MTEEKILQYIKLRQKELGLIVGGLNHSRRLTKNKWTPKDELEFQKVNSRKKEQDCLLFRIKHIDKYIGRSKRNIERIKNRNDFKYLTEK